MLLKMNTGKGWKRHSRQKKSTLEDDSREAAGRSAVAVQTDPVDGSPGIRRQTGGSRHREETSAKDPNTGRVRTANQGDPSKPPPPSPPPPSHDTKKHGASCEPCDDIPTLMVPGRIVHNVYPVRYQGTVLYIPTGGFLRPHGLLHKMTSEE